MTISKQGQVTDHQLLIDVPELENGIQVEIIIKLDGKRKTSLIKRSPPASLAGKVKILGDIVEPIVDEEDWECLK